MDTDLNPPFIHLIPFIRLAVLVALCSFFPSSSGNAQTEKFKEPSRASDEKPASSNGIIAIITIPWNESNRGLPDIDVRVSTTNANQFFSKPSSEDGYLVDVAHEIAYDKSLYFTSTNLFCGPIELADSAGNKLFLLRPEVCSMNSYPATFSLREARKHNPHPPTAYPMPLMFSPTPLARFSLGDYFSIKQPGEYMLKVSPKIYKRDSTNDDICKRIDLARVSIVVKIDATALK